MATMRTLKNVAKNYSPAQVKVREATSNDPWGPSSSIMSEIADLSYNVVAFTEIMTLLWKRLSDHGKNWRHVYKSLVVLEYIIKTGSERVAQQCKENIFAINTLKDFQFLDRDGKDQGMNVREKSKNLVALLKDDERLKSERTRALKAKERFAQSSQGIGSDTKYVGTESSSSSSPTSNGGDSHDHSRLGTSEIEQARPTTAGEEDLQLQLALAMSREEAEQQTKQSRSDDIRLQMALNESLEDAKPQPTLLNLAEPPPAQPKADPWGLPSGGTASSDPWTVPAQATSQPAMDPWGAPSKPAMPDPWGAPPAQPPAPLPAKPNNDPWGAVPEPAKPIQNDLWTLGAPVAAPPAAVPAASSNQVDWGFNSAAPAAMPASDPDLDFDLLRSNTSSQSKPVGAFDMGLLNDAIPQQQPMINQSKPNKPQKKPEDFLGENSSLVNLDSLIVTKKPDQSNPSAQMNPFVFGGMPSAVAPVSNPFQQQQAPRPTLNQMRAQPIMTATVPGGYGMGQQPAMMGAAGLPPPLLPMAQNSMQMPAQNQATNPFLL